MPMPTYIILSLDVHFAVFDRDNVIDHEADHVPGCGYMTIDTTLN